MACTAVNASDASPAYFFNNTANHPLDAWDFSAIWRTNATSYPTLRNLDAFSRAGVPNNGDANGDGTADAYQPNVLDVRDANGVWATVAVAGSSSNCELGSPTSASAQALTGYSALTSLTGFSIYCASTGATVSVSIIYDKVYANPTVRYYNTATHSLTAIPNATLATVTIGGTTKTELTYTLTDGSSLDEDGSANGIIVDPIVLYAPVIASPNTGYGRAGTYSGSNLLAGGLFGFGVALVAVAAMYRRQRA
ncbi:MAG TPA: choice-of-anchor U domain-containing protein [Candidatus Saccharimonadales bacterium]|nr:choice-of-anchor U domain-containing protein [Candidatus Saccharimonadales bacterium]